MSNDFPINEDEQQVLFHSEDIDFELQKEEQITTWINAIIEKENKTLEQINFIFCSDSYLHQINVEYLNHDTLTDVITFPYAKLPVVEGDIFISLERIKENGKIFEVSFEEELHRVMIHGVLHLCGYGDKTVEDKKQMTQKENDALAFLKQMS